MGTKRNGTKKDWPTWLKQAKVGRTEVEIGINGVVIWKGGVWEDGIWKGGVWKGGTWKDGIWEGGRWEGGTWKGGRWEGGIWKDGRWEGGIWKDGIWEGGRWEGGTWKDGIWEGGVWKGGKWYGQEDRLFYMASSLGIVFDESGYGRAYRTTLKNGRGRWNPHFTQLNGRYHEEGLPAAGSGTCTRGIHVTSAQRAWSYFGVDPNCEFWEVTFNKEDLLDCDGEKARIRGGEFKRIERPF